MLCDPGTPCVRFRTVTEHELDSTTAQFVLLTSMQKLDQAKRSRGGIRLRRGLLIAVTALKARQLLWELDNHPYEGYITPSEDISLSTFSKPAVTETEGCLASTCALTTGPVEDVQCTSPVWPIQDRIQTPNAPNSTTDTVFDSESSSSPFSTLPNLEYVFPPISHLYFASSDADITEAHDSPFSSDIPSVHYVDTSEPCEQSCLDYILLSEPITTCALPRTVETSLNQVDHRLCLEIS
ncbi:hypothetical protein CSKR_200152 [Clonorchis sinensis]|uniref:Uncharacterized protein n=1 Tax=Clonorchis sinensis TaxID=79923 RepID=A0A8T1LZE8_CLOSI|nr:hypothetical protein CSKR_200152 [Clonorchis sinensis]